MGFPGLHQDADRVLRGVVPWAEHGGAQRDDQSQVPEAVCAIDPRR